MNQNNPLDIIDLNKIEIIFNNKPIVVGGMAMEYYGLRKHGNDINFIVSNCDYLKLEKRYRNCRKDIWGDFGVSVNEYELFRSWWKFDYNYFDNGSIEFGQYKFVSIDILFRMKVLAIEVEDKQKNDVDLLKEYFMKCRNKEWVEKKKKNSDRYLKAESSGVKDGLIINGDYY
jgi:hypothetical protein